MYVYTYCTHMCVYACLCTCAHVGLIAIDADCVKYVLESFVCLGVVTAIGNNGRKSRAVSVWRTYACV